uniref:Uncharacterized protein n=1 Tax=Oryza nivara TaxID=4536 RepID=A0A0E0IQL1_ORYNI
MAALVVLWPTLLPLVLLANLLPLPRHGRALELMNWSCNNGSSYAANTTYHSNVRAVLTALSAITPNSTARFATASAGRGGADAVWGLALCRGDTNRAGCASCLAAVPAVAFGECRGDRDVAVFYDRCLARFSYADFTARPDNTEVLIGSPSENRVTVDAGRFDALVARLAGALADWAAYNSTRRYAAGVMASGDGFTSTTEDMVHNIYGVVQCTPDQAAAACRACLEALRVDMPKVFAGRIGGRFDAVWCNLRYETFLFYDGDPTVRLAASPLPWPSPGSSSSPLPSPSPGSSSSPLPSPSPSLPPLEGKRRNRPKNAAIVVVSVLASLVVLLSLLSFYLWRKLQAKQYTDENDIYSGSLLFDLATLRKATASFAEHNKLGHGGFGAVYKGFLPDGREIAVKRLDKTSGQGLEQLRNELLFVAKLRHNNLAKLLGVCIKGEEKLLIYEYLPNRSLDTFLFDPEKRGQLNWETRYQIIHGIARGLLYLHEDSQIKIIHRDLKASNVLLDANMNPKISDFGLARLFDGTKTASITNHVVGTLGYMAPEYAVLGHVSVKLDVYSFGILVLEIVTGRRNTDVLGEVEESNNLLSYVWDHWVKGTPLEIADASLLGDDRGLSDMELLKCVHFGLLCVQENPVDRPTMLDILVMLHDVDTNSFVAPSKPAFTFAHGGNTTSSSQDAMATRVLLSSKVILALVLASLFSLPRHGRALELMNWSCNNGSAYAANTTYDTNVHSILATLTARTPNTTTGFATATTGRGTDTEAWGLALCRGDTDRVGCASCLAAVPAVAFNECRGDMDVTVFYDRCLARFSYVDFTARPDNTEVLIGSPSADRITADAGHFDALVADLAGALADWAAYNSTLRYAAGVMTSGDGFMSTTEDMVHNIYGVVQCTPDQAAAACRACLEALRVDMPKVFAGKMGGRFNAVWCNLRYETFVFFDGDPSVKLVAPPVVPEDDAADKDVDSGSLLFDLAIIRKATANFAEHNKLGHGGFGAVYKGFLPDVGEIAVKRLDRTSGQGLEQLRNELLLVAKLRHNNLAKLLGVCIKGDEKLLVYEFLPNRSLDTILFDPQKREQLSWETRYQIIHGTARGLLYLHEDSQIKIIHRDLKASNVLLDSNMNPKISDFGLARLFSGTKTTSITSQVVGTLGYMAPEYAVLGHLSVKVDVYSFGILVLEIVTGRRNTDVFDADEESSNLLSYVWDHWQKGIPLEITDTLLLLSGSRGLQDMELLKCVHIGLLCVQENPADRPTMLSVLVMLQDIDTTNFAAPSKPAFTFANVRNTTSSSPSAAALSANEVSISEFHPR